MERMENLYYPTGLGKASFNFNQVPNYQEQCQPQEEHEIQIYQEMSFNDVLEFIDSKVDLIDVILVLLPVDIKRVKIGEEELEFFRFSLLDIISWSSGLSLLKTSLSALEAVLHVTRSGKKGEELYNKFLPSRVFEIDHIQKASKKNPETGEFYSFYVFKFGAVREDQGMLFMKLFEERSKNIGEEGERKEPIDFSALGGKQMKKIPTKRVKKE